jgi:hypothetical protein
MSSWAPPESERESILSFVDVKDFGGKSTKLLRVIHSGSAI